MTCDSCVKSVSESLYRLNGIAKVEADLQAQLVSIEGTGMAPCNLASPIRAPVRQRPARFNVACFVPANRPFQRPPLSL